MQQQQTSRLDQKEPNIASRDGPSTKNTSTIKKKIKTACRERMHPVHANLSTMFLQTTGQKKDIGHVGPRISGKVRNQKREAAKEHYSCTKTHDGT